jgi:hypothetical protein
VDRESDGGEREGGKEGGYGIVGGREKKRESKGEGDLSTLETLHIFNLHSPLCL